MNLAEIHLLAQDLSLLKNQTLSDFYTNDQYINKNEFSQSTIFPVIAVAGVTMLPKLQFIGRWGRHIILTFSTCTVVVKMSYKTAIMVSRGVYPENLRHQDIAGLLTFSGIDSLYLVYSDPLGCGSLSVYPAGTVPNEFSHLGIDVFDTLFTPQYLMSEIIKLAYSDRKKCVKSFLMSNSVIAWVDNEMISEALFLSGINPYLSAESGISYGNARVLVKSLKVLYFRAMAVVRNDWCLMKAPSINAIYSVYGREGADCLMCGDRVLRGIIDGKSTYWCPNCQTNHKKDVAYV